MKRGTREVDVANVSVKRGHRKSIHRSFRYKLKKIMSSETTKSRCVTPYDEQAFLKMPLNAPPRDAVPKEVIRLNRFINVLPNKHSRVALDPLRTTDGSVVTGSDYINANWLRGYSLRPRQ